MTYSYSSSWGLVWIQSNNDPWKLHSTCLHNHTKSRINLQTLPIGLSLVFSLEEFVCVCVFSLRPKATAGMTPACVWIMTAWTTCHILSFKTSSLHSTCLCKHGPRFLAGKYDELIAEYEVAPKHKIAADMVDDFRILLTCPSENIKDNQIIIK